MISTVVLISVLILSLLYLSLKYKYNYWKKKKLPYLEPTSLFGNYGPHILQKEVVGEVVQRICEEFPNEALVGAFVGTKPVLIPVKPDAVKLITTRAFQNFNSRELMDYSEKDLIGRGLLMMHGEKWKYTRSNLTPMFSSAKLKNMFYLTETAIDGFEKYLETDIGEKPFEAKTLMAQFTLSVFVSCVFGIELNYGETSAFSKLADNFFTVHWIRGVFLNIRMIWPALFYGLGFKMIPNEIEIFFKKFLTEIFEVRANKPSGRNDFVDSLLKLKEKDVDDDYIVAQSVAIFIAGFETSATALGFLLFELAKNEEIQAKAQKEIDGVLKKLGGKMTFEGLSDLPYLEACMFETLRRYPILTVLTREVTEDFTLLNGSVLEKGLRVHIPVYYLHHNPEYFPNPKEFRPERFYGETKQEIVPYSFLPFGEGPRVCIGKRFAMIQSLSALVMVLKKYKVVLAEGMAGELELEPRAISTTAKNGIHLKLLPRT